LWNSTFIIIGWKWWWPLENLLNPYEYIMKLPMQARKKRYEPMKKVRNFALKAPKLENPKPTQKNKQFGRMNHN
jgi:hypothetical protein